MQDVDQQVIEMYGQNSTELEVDDKPERSMGDHKFTNIVEDTINLKEATMRLDCH